MGRSGRQGIRSIRRDAIFFDFDGVLVESADIKRQAFRDLYSDYGERAVACSSVAGSLDLLRRNIGKKMFVVSGTPEPELRDIVERRGMTDYFEAVCGSPKRWGPTSLDGLAPWMPVRSPMERRWLAI